MSKICIWGDNHWSQYSSILRKRGDKYSVRLENSIASLNWVENLATSQGCSFVVCTGDFFDAAVLKAEELTALEDIKWNNLPHMFLVGNHEMGRSDLRYSSAHVFGNIQNASVIDKSCLIQLPELDIVLLPYILESDRKPLQEYIKPLNCLNNKRIIISHNDIKGIQMGKFESVEGFKIDEIEGNCDFFFNGHLHNGSQVTSKIINVGNLTGQNFSEDAFKYDHVAIIFDTLTMQCDVYENPYAFNFYKISYPFDFNTLKYNSVVTIQVNEDTVDACKSAIEKSDKVVEYRLVIGNSPSHVKVEDTSSLSLDHISEFKTYVLNNIGDDDIVKSELSALFSRG